MFAGKNLPNAAQSVEVALIHGPRFSETLRIKKRAWMLDLRTCGPRTPCLGTYAPSGLVVVGYLGYS